MNIRQAILKAASSIESEPSQYSFCSGFVHPCGTPMCMFGWIGYHLGMESGTCNMYVANAIGLRHTLDLYDFVGSRNCFDPAKAAAGLRRFADERFPSTSRALIPESVRAIFAMTPEQIRAEFQKDAA